MHRTVSTKTFQLSALSVIICLMVQLVGSSLFSTGTALAQTATAKPENPFGVNTFFDKEVEDWKKDKTFQMIQAANIGWIKQQFSWEEIETKKGYFVDDKFNKSAWQKYDQIVDLATKYKINIVARVDRTPKWAQIPGNNAQYIPADLKNYGDFIKEFVKHYKGKINYIQVWNEPNLGEEWNGTVDVKKYAEMLKIAYEAAKSVDPNIKIMSAPLAMNVEKGPVHLNELDFMTQLYAAGGKQYFDLVSANGYGLEYAPEDAPDPSKLNFRRVELLRNIMVKNGDEGKQIWFNEYGWNASPESMPKDKLIWRRVTEQQQADYTVRGYQYARANYPWAGVIFIWYFRQVGDIDTARSDYYFQMVTPEFTTKPIYDAVKKEATTFLASKGQATTAQATTAAAGTPAAKTTGAATTAAVATTTVAAGTTSATTAASQTTVAAVASPAPSSSSSSDSGGGMIFIIIGAVLVVLAGGGAGYFLMQNRNR